MGLFNWFTSSNSTVLPDVIWLTKEAKLNGLAHSVSEALARPEPPNAVLLVGHFHDTIADLQKLIVDSRITGPVAVVRAQDLSN